MALDDQISRYLDSIPEPKRTDMRKLHDAVLELNPGCQLWFLDGKDESGKVVSNPNIGYGTLHKKYADGNIKSFYQVGISANSMGLSVYIMGMDDKSYLREKYTHAIGKASITGYCIKFKALKDISLDTLKQAIQEGMTRTSA
ncbi:MAG: DUF1801 domain-containing protein [Acidobacteria bacterium]|nr:DUF1801 domain-containing protein [Acidobacteriota bacterium]MBI3490002.1 DUF1801 domain-containing protein [Acidobacteriota bacterium]